MPSWSESEQRYVGADDGQYRGGPWHGDHPREHGNSRYPGEAGSASGGRSEAEDDPNAIQWIGSGIGDVTDAFGLNPDRERRREDRLRQEQRDIWDSLYGQIPEQAPLRSEVAGAESDPYARQAQEQTLRQLGTLAQGGYMQGDYARLRQMQGEMGRQERGQREALMAQQQARGMGASGTALAGQLAAQQGAATRSNEFGLGVEALAQQRQIEAMGMRGQLAGDVRKGSFAEDVTRRGAQDEVNRFNYETPWRRYGAIERIAQGKTGTVLGEAQSAQQREQEARRGLGALAAGVASWFKDDED